MIIAQLHSTKPELKFCAGSSPARAVSETWDGEDLWEWLEIRLNAFRRSTKPQKQLIIIIFTSPKPRLKLSSYTLKWNSHDAESFLRSSSPEKFNKNSVLKNFIKFAGKHLCRSLFLLKKIDSDTGAFLWILRNLWKHLFKEHLRWMLPNLTKF